MSKVGTFNKATDDESSSGTLHTLQGSREVVFQRIEKASENAPSFSAMLLRISAQRNRLFQFIVTARSG